MKNHKTCLASDNWAPAHPLVIHAVVEANQDCAPAYGSDQWTEKAEKLIRSAFARNCSVFLIPTGTGTNIFALRLACRRYESILCTDIAHIQYQESGAVESIVGCKLLSIPHRGGKVTPEGVLRRLRSERAFGRHCTFPRLLSITQPTEVGTVYRLEELEGLAKLCKDEGLLFHMDGSRLFNAAVSLGVNLTDIVDAAQLDLLSLGGTKNGLMGAEALLVFNSILLEGSDYLQKQTLQLLSKMRYLSAQYIPFFKDNLWHDLASQANQRAQDIAALIVRTPHLSLNYPVETNQIFFTAPASWIPLIQEKISCLPWDQERNELRFIASWNTSEQDVREVEEALREIARNPI